MSWSKAIFTDETYPYFYIFTFALLVLYFVLTTNYRNWWIYKVIMGKKAKPAGARNWAEKWNEKSRAEAKKIREDAERFRRE